MLEIAADHDRESNHLQDSAEYFAKTIQKFDGVHSVRWRVKDTEHLLEKIIRKRAEGNAKYSDSDNRLVQYFLEIFNRMAGSADDMGGFVLGLVATLKEMDQEILASKNAKESTLKEMEHALAQLEKAKRQDHSSRESIASLKKELEKLRKVNHPYSRGLDTLAGVQNFQNAHMQSLNDMARMAKERLNQQNEAWREATKGLLNPAGHGLLAGGLLDVPSGPKKDKPEN